MEVLSNHSETPETPTFKESDQPSRSIFEDCPMRDEFPQAPLHLTMMRQGLQSFSLPDSGPGTLAPNTSVSTNTAASVEVSEPFQRLGLTDYPKHTFNQPIVASKRRVSETSFGLDLKTKPAPNAPVIPVKDCAIKVGILDEEGWTYSEQSSSDSDEDDEADITEEIRRILESSRSSDKKEGGSPSSCKPESPLQLKELENLPSVCNDSTMMGSELPQT